MARRYQANNNLHAIQNCLLFSANCWFNFHTRNHFTIILFRWCHAEDKFKHLSMFLDTQVSLAPTDVRLCWLVGPLVTLSNFQSLVALSEKWKVKSEMWKVKMWKVKSKKWKVKNEKWKVKGEKWMVKGVRLCGGYVFFKVYFVQSVFIQSVFLRNVPDLRV